MSRSLTTRFLLPLLLLAFTARTDAAIEATALFDLGTPDVTATTASIDIGLNFTQLTGLSNIQGIQLSVVGSSPELTYDRFTFTPDPVVLDGWIPFVGSFAPFGIDGFVPFDPFDHYILPQPGQQIIGSLTIDLTGIAGGTPLLVTIANGGVGFSDTDVFGDAGGDYVDSYRDSDIAEVLFADPDGVPFTTVVPEPASVLTWSGLGLIVAFFTRFRRRRPV